MDFSSLWNFNKSKNKNLIQKNIIYKIWLFVTRDCFCNAYDCTERAMAHTGKKNYL
jgi:hypothetical protein